jgi:hypothetical protein
MGFCELYFSNNLSNKLNSIAHKAIKRDQHKISYLFVDEF